MDISFRDLRCFVAIAGHGSLGRAASEIRVAQPTLSRTIKEMERRLGQSLFERHTRGMALTVAGEELLPHARQMLFDMEQATESLDALRGLSRGTARIGAVAAVARSVLPEAVGRLLAQTPGVLVHVLEATDNQLFAALADRSVDLVIAAECVPGKDIGVVAECRFDDDYSVFCAAKHSLASKADVTLEDVLGEQWVMPGPGSTPRLLFDDLVAGRQEPRIAVETGSSGVMVPLVAGTRLLGWLPRPLLKAETDAGAIRQLDIPALSVRRRFFLYRRSKSLLPRAAQQLRECLPLIP